ncbi:MAG: FkbM family methyltransferase [Bacteroidia bacterium]|nr:FkbM family methyltransferase [Bacteroidia bacterium]
MWFRIRGRRWMDTIALWINGLFWLPRRWYWEWQLGSREAAWRHLMQRPRYHWSQWPLRLKGRYYTSDRKIWLDQGSLIWFIAGMQGDRFPFSWLKAIGTGRIGFDVGAHRGYWTLYHSRHFPTSCKVILLEPEPHNYTYLLCNLAVNKATFALPLPLAAWRSPTRLRLLQKESSTDHTSFGHQVREDPQGETWATSIDALVQAYALPSVDWIKIDVEGAEVAVLEGAQDTLERFGPTLWIEIHDTWEPVTKLLLERGYILRETIRLTAPDDSFQEIGYIWAEKSDSAAQKERPLPPA